jgi:hypothetical protein
MEFSNPIDPNARYQVIDPIFFNDEVIGVLEGKYVRGKVGRRLVTGYRVEHRTSFKHPIAGLALGLALVGLPLQALAGDPLGLGGFLAGTNMRTIGALFMVCFGVYVLWEVARRRQEPWLVFVIEGGERGFPLTKELSPQALETLKTIIGGVPARREA